MPTTVEQQFDPTANPADSQFNYDNGQTTGVDYTNSGNGSGSGGSGSSGGSAGLGTVGNGDLVYQPVQYAIPSVNFTYAVLNDTTVAFTNKTLNTYGSCKWWFGDGQVSTEINPRHKFPKAGTYQVKLVCWTPDLVKSGSKTITVEVGSFAKVAAFSSIVNTLEIIFTWTGTFIPSSVLWDFGDGTFSTELNPRHTYAAAGSYNVTVYSDTGESASGTVTASGESVLGQFINKFGSIGSGDGQFSFLRSIVVDDQYIYVADSGNTRVQVFNKSTYAFIGKFGSNGTGDGQFNAPEGIAVDDLYIYVADNSQNRVQIFNKSTYAFVGKFGSVGAGDGQFNGPYGIAVDESLIYVTEDNNNRVQVFNKSTYAFVGKFGSAGSGDGQFSLPRTIDVDTTSIYITERGNNRVQIFNKSTYAFVGKFGSIGSGDGQFSSPEGNAVDDLYIYVADTNNRRVQVFQKATVAYIAPPTADFSVDVQSGAAPLTVVFTNLSTGDGLTYLWEFGDGTTSTAANPTHVFQEGTFTPRLTVTDSLGVVDDTIGRIVATIAGTAFKIDPPIAKFIASPMIGSRDPGTGLLTVTFTDTSTGSPTTWSWKVNGVEFSTSQNPTRDFAADGIYVVELTAGNAEGFTSPTSQAIIVTANVVPEDNAPTSVITASQTSIFFGESVAFSATPSTPDVTYLWEFGDGSGSTEAAPTHTFGLPGTYEVILTTTNAWGSTETRMTIVVQGTVRFSGGSGADMGTYILDRKNHRILMYDVNNAYAGAIGSFGSALGKFNNPTTIFVSRPIFNRR